VQVFCQQGFEKATNKDIAAASGEWLTWPDLHTLRIKKRLVSAGG